MSVLIVHGGIRALKTDSGVVHVPVADELLENYIIGVLGFHQKEGRSEAENLQGLPTHFAHKLTSIKKPLKFKV